MTILTTLVTHKVKEEGNKVNSCSESETESGRYALMQCKANSFLSQYIVSLEWQNKHYLQAKKDAMLLNPQKYSSPVGGLKHSWSVKSKSRMLITNTSWIVSPTHSHTLDYIMTLSIYTHFWDHKALVNDIWTVRSHTLTTWMKMISQQIE